MVVRQSLCLWASCAAAKKPLSVQFVLDVKFGFSIFSDDAMKKPGHDRLHPHPNNSLHHAKSVVHQR